MLKHAANLSSSFEYYIGWTGQSTARPWGSVAEGRSYFADFGLELNGFTAPATSLSIPTAGAPGTTEIITVSPAVLTAGQWRNTKLRLGSVNLLVPGYAKILDNTAGTLTVEWISQATGGPGLYAGYFIRDDFKWAKYPQVRVLTPMQPFTDDASPPEYYLPYPTPNGPWNLTPTPTTIQGQGMQLPAPFTAQPDVLSFEDQAVFLDFTFAEGIAGYGISEIADSAGATPHPITDITQAAGVYTLTFTNAINANVLVDGYVIIDWEDDSTPVVPGMHRSWGLVTGNTANTFTVSTWLGAGPPILWADGGRVRRYTAWVPHFLDNPHSFIPGPGFNYPNNEMQPGGFPGNPRIRNRPRGYANAAYSDRFGDLLVAASRLSSAIGKRVNVVHLGINSSSLGPNNVPSTFGFYGLVGWFNPQESSTWSPAIATSLYRRTLRLISMVAPALRAEGSTKTAKCLGWVHLQGEGDALLGSARQHYYQSVRAFATGIRNAITAAGHNPYSNGAKVPFVQPQLMIMPYEQSGVVSYYGVPVAVDGDSEKRVNSAIREHSAADGFAGTIFTEDLPRALPDSGHCNGVGEAERGARLADLLGQLIDYALGYGAAANILNQPPSRIVEICNLALASIGETATLTSLDDGSVQANLCKQFLPEARKKLLQMRQWSFAKRRVSLWAIRKPEELLYQHFKYCYPVPKEALNSFHVLPPVVETPEFDFNKVLATEYSTNFVLNRGRQSATTPLPIIEDAKLTPVDHVMEKSPNGNLLVFTNQRQATLQYVADVVDADLYPAAFVDALVPWLGSLLAGAIIKGDAGEAVAERQRRRAAAALGAAAISDANQQQQTKVYIPDHLANR